MKVHEVLTLQLSHSRSVRMYLSNPWSVVVYLCGLVWILGVKTDLLG